MSLFQEVRLSMPEKEKNKETKSPMESAIEDMLKAAETMDDTVDAILESAEEKKPAAKTDF